MTKEIIYSYDSSKKIIDMVAAATGGSIEGKFVKVDNALIKSVNYVLEEEFKMEALLIDTKFNEDCMVRFTSPDNGYVSISFIIADKFITFNHNKEVKKIGKWSYNMYINDVTLGNRYLIKKDTHVFSISMFIKKEALKKDLEDAGMLNDYTEVIFDDKINTIVCMNRMSYDSLNMINDFRAIPYNHVFFDLYFKSISNSLIYNCLSEISKERVLISKVTDDDFNRILQSKRSLLECVEGHFPGIDSLATQAMMSNSKYKKLFAKINGITPAAYFNRKKLIRAKELLELKDFTINEIVSQLNYCSTSYFAKCFKENYGFCPKEFQKILK